MSFGGLGGRDEVKPQQPLYDDPRLLVPTVPVVDQTRLGSFIEAWVNVAIGFGINFAANMLILPAFGFTSLTLGTNLIIGLIYTVISVARSYVIRRWFNAKLKRVASRLAEKLS